MANKVDMRGMRFGRLTVIEPSQRKDSHQSWWVCKCDCGNTKEIRRSSLIKGETKSCGCYAKEVTSKCNKQRMTKHGFYGTRLYRILKGMVARCENPNNPQYSNYGGRGISVCDEWRKDPGMFFAWALGNGYSDKLTIDRINPDGDYEPNNCRWLTMDEQQLNKRTNVRITYNGQTKCVAEWARELSTPNYLLYQRVANGWQNPEEILFGRKEGIVNG